MLRYAYKLICKLVANGSERATYGTADRKGRVKCRRVQPSGRRFTRAVL